MRILITSILFAFIGLCFYQLILVTDVQDFNRSSVVEGVARAADCEFLENKNKSYYMFSLHSGVEIKVRVSNHRCDSAIINAAETGIVRAYFKGGFPLDVSVDGKQLVDFQTARSENNTLYGCLMLFLIAGVIYIQFIFHRKS